MDLGDWIVVAVASLITFSLNGFTLLALTIGFLVSFFIVLALSALRR